MKPYERKWDIEVAQLRRLFAATPIGSVISYSEMSILTGVNITCNHAALVRAIRESQRHERIVMLAVRLVGYRRAEDDSKAEATRNRTRKTFRAAKRGLAVAHCVDVSNIDPQKRVSLYACVAALDSVARSTHGNSLNAVAKPKSNFASEQLRAGALARIDFHFGKGK